MIPELTSLNSVQILDFEGGRSQCLDERSIPMLTRPVSACPPGILLGEYIGAVVEQ